jgi:hypothetical protein
MSVFRDGESRAMASEWTVIACFVSPILKVKRAEVNILKPSELNLADERPTTYSSYIWFKWYTAAKSKFCGKR